MIVVEVFFVLFCNIHSVSLQVGLWCPEVCYYLDDANE